MTPGFYVDADKEMLADLLIDADREDDGRLVRVLKGCIVLPDMIVAAVPIPNGSTAEWLPNVMVRQIRLGYEGRHWHVTAWVSSDAFCGRCYVRDQKAGGPAWYLRKSLVPTVSALRGIYTAGIEYSAFVPDKGQYIALIKIIDKLGGWQCTLDT
jgi:hypothetical protein